MAEEVSVSKPDEEDAAGDSSSADHLPPYRGRSLLSKEQQATIFEILKCAVCLEIPRGGANLQVKTCEKGHHFCMACHKKLKSCAICRGRLFVGRNFAVEEIISKLGPALGVTKPLLPTPPPAPLITRGRFSCPHNCDKEIPGISLLPHIRAVHSELLADNLRSNPYTLRVDWRLTVVYKEDATSAFSLQISDMGLMTIKVRFYERDLRVWVQTVTRQHTSPDFKYRVTLRHSNSDFSLNETPVLGYFAPRETPAFNVPSSLLPTIGSSLELFVAIWRTGDELKPEFDSTPLVPEPPVLFASDRSTRRNRKRNFRKTRARARLRQRKKNMEKGIPEVPPNLEDGQDRICAQQ